MLGAMAQAASKPSALIDTRVIYCGDNLEQLRKLPDACVDLIYIDPPFNSNRNYEVSGARRKRNARSQIDMHQGRLTSSSCGGAAWSSRACSKTTPLCQNC